MEKEYVVNIVLVILAGFGLECLFDVPAVAGIVGWGTLCFLSTKIDFFPLFMVVSAMLALAGIVDLITVGMEGIGIILVILLAGGAFFGAKKEGEKKSSVLDEWEKAPVPSENTEDNDLENVEEDFDKDPIPQDVSSLSDLFEEGRRLKEANESILNTPADVTPEEIPPIEEFDSADSSSNTYDNF